MLTWLRKNWRWALLNAVALLIMADVLLRGPSVKSYGPDFSVLVNSAKWAVRFLLISLLMSPLNTYFGWRSAVGLRKSAGLWAFAFGSLHFIVYITDSNSQWLLYPIPDWIAGLGVVTLLVLLAMAATSTKWAQRRMGKWWKRLHRLVYGAGIAAVTHGLLETSNKRVMITDENAAYEVTLYIALLAVLLLVRVPLVRGWLRGLTQRSQRVASGGEA